MRSMTGFGIGHSELGAGRLCVEVKSLNHRYLDVRVRVPTELGDHSFFLEHLARSHFSRGRFDVQLRVEGQALSGPVLDVERVRSVFYQLAALREELCPQSELSLTALAALPSLYIESPDLDADKIRVAISDAFGQAHRHLITMRAAEGRNLQNMLLELLSRARALTAQCELRCAETIVGHRDRLRERAAKLLDGTEVAIDSARLELEVTLLAERSDATEELSRLGSHFAMFGSLLESSEPSGRRLDFLLQEIARETNTLGAKSQDATLSHLVVELKAEAERMREQVQNVE
jgi:uncharacterized protein (TIGR00255 family)